jgi:hypothetical protein
MSKKSRYAVVVQEQRDLVAIEIEDTERKLAELRTRLSILNKLEAAVSKKEKPAPAAPSAGKEKL